VWTCFRCVAALAYERFAECPVDADEGKITYYCRAWVLNPIGSVLFPDAIGDSASWITSTACGTGTMQVRVCPANVNELLHCCLL
jgi:hypothetical protein